jgi:hypothetical protein
LESTIKIPIESGITEIRAAMSGELLFSADGCGNGIAVDHIWLSLESQMHVVVGLEKCHLWCDAH